MTINKSQGQALKAVGLNLSGDVFSHGQLMSGVLGLRMGMVFIITLPAQM